jgi:acylphosphatase
MTSLLLRISGRVQGVNFRAAMCDAARREGVSGWVRNRRDGTVEALVHGEPAAVAALLAWAQRGPPAARVARVDQAPAPPQEAGTATGFEMRPTL